MTISVDSVRGIYASAVEKEKRALDATVAECERYVNEAAAACKGHAEFTGPHLVQMFRQHGVSTLSENEVVNRVGSAFKNAKFKVASEYKPEGAGESTLVLTVSGWA